MSYLLRIDLRCDRGDRRGLPDNVPPVPTVSPALPAVLVATPDGDLSVVTPPAGEHRPNRTVSRAASSTEIGDPTPLSPATSRTARTSVPGWSAGWWTTSSPGNTEPARIAVLPVAWGRHKKDDLLAGALAWHRR
ncbi:hypothetical protein HBB16_01235 [Pseudonocardia sp. MCCB 268]|nr:hypothetical protein [Pseudonocardia cytotoxica]